MSKFLKRSELAKALSIQNASVTQAVKNGTLISENDNTINIEKEINRIWIDRQIAKGRDFNLNNIFKTTVETEPYRVKKTKEQPDQVHNEKKEKSILTLRELEIQKKKADIQKTRRDIKLAEIKIAKQEGELIPFEAAKTVFLFFIETWKNTYKQEARSLANIYVNRLGAEHKHFIELQKELNQFIETINKEAIKSAMSGLDGIVEEFREVRGRGEKI